jgi:hypothetical protein
VPLEVPLVPLAPLDEPMLDAPEPASEEVEPAPDCA